MGLAMVLYQARGLVHRFAPGPAVLVPVSRAGVPKPFRTLALSGPAADTSGEFNLNGIQAVRGGETLIVAHSTNAQLYTVDPTSWASATIAGISVPRSTAWC
jgi:hypothetical protein